MRSTKASSTAMCRTTTRRRPRRLLGALLGASLLVATACGDDDVDVDPLGPEATATPTGDVGEDPVDDAAVEESPDEAPVTPGGDGARLDDAAFCARMESLEDEFDDDAALDPETFAVLAELAELAPDEGVREALGRFEDLAQQLEGLDDDDPEAFGIALAIMFDPEFIESMEAFDRYLVDVCGIETDDGFGEPLGDDAFDPDGE